MKRRVPLLLALVLCGATLPSAGAAEVVEHHDWSLIAAAQMGDTNAVKDLLARGANPNTRVNANENLLHRAILFRQPAVVRLLIEHGATVDTRSVPWRTTIEPEIADILAKAGFQQPPEEPSRRPSHRRPLKPLGAEECIRAIRNNDPVALKEILSARGLSVDAPIGDSGATPLMVAVDFRKPDLVRFLLEQGANPNARNADEESILHHAVCDWQGSLPPTDLERLADIVKILHQGGADLSASPYWGGANTVLIAAAQVGRSEMIKALLATGWYTNRQDELRTALRNTSNAAGRHPAVASLLAETLGEKPRLETDLMKAVSALDVARVTALLANPDLDLEIRDARGQTALFRAVLESKRDWSRADWEKKVEIIRLLLQRGARANVEDNSETAALAIATQFRQPPLVKLLLDHGADRDIPWFGYTDLMLAALADDPQRAEALIARGAYLHFKSGDGHSESAADLAALHSPAVFRLLTDAGAPVSAGTLEKTAQTGRADTVLMVLERGVQIDPERTLALAVRSGSEETVKLLLVRGAPVNPTNAFMLPLHVAASDGNLPMVRFLIENGARVDLPDRHGGKVMAPAVRSGNVELVKFLLKKGADVNAPHLYGVTPLDLARYRKDAEMIRVLEKAGGKSSGIDLK